MRVSFENSQGRRLVGDWLGHASRVVIACHGMLSNRQGTKVSTLCERLEAAGIGSLRFDFSGRGESEGDASHLTYSEQLQDLLDAIDWVAQKGVTHIGLFGSSMGGAVAFLAAARDERVTALATVGAVAHPDRLAERYPESVKLWEAGESIKTDDGELLPSFYHDALEHDSAGIASVIRSPVLVLHGENDDVVPPADAHDLASACRTATLQYLPGADHRITQDDAFERMMELLLNFFGSNL